ncbi:MAG: NifB/NifX family molybdenum-iron cluster-binding protein [Chromatiaceae bacterium]|jgi:nitrogen fixation protein NifX|nr:NifB/NifX family molybdenum-iron cluster-binding protein [Chromatiaceae bacterium]
MRSADETRGRLNGRKALAVDRRLQIVDTSLGTETPAPVVRVAFATSDLKQVDQHFGAAEGFAVYGVDPDRARLLEATRFTRLEAGGNEGGLAVKVRALDGCVAVYCEAVGASAIRQLLRQGMRPVKVAAGTSIADLIVEVQRELRAGPGGWLARAGERRRPTSRGRFDDMEVDGWSE